MQDRVRRAALRAAAKLALGSSSLGALGCGGRVVTLSAAGSESSGGAPGLGGSPALSHGAGPASDAGQVSPDARCVGPFDLPEQRATSGPSTAEYECCVEYVTSNAVAGAQAPTSEQDPEFFDCCKAIIAAVDVDSSRYEQALPTFSACCTSGLLPQTVAWNHAFCTPWGPAVPSELEPGLT